EGPTLQRWKDRGVFAFERLGGGHLLVALNNDENVTRKITVDTGFGPNVALVDFARHQGGIATDGAARVTMTIPTNRGGNAYVCSARPTSIVPFAVQRVAPTQDYEGAADLDIPPARDDAAHVVCRVFADVHTTVAATLSFDGSHWADNTSIRLDLE